MKKFILILLSTILLVFCTIILNFILILNGYGYGSDKIGNFNIMISTSESPSGKYIAYIFNRNLGATTKDNYQLTILEKNDKFRNGTGNVFISYDRFGIQWVNDNELIVDVNTSSYSNIFKQEHRIFDIDVKYE